MSLRIRACGKQISSLSAGSAPFVVGQSWLWWYSCCKDKELLGKEDMG